MVFAPCRGILHTTNVDQWEFHRSKSAELPSPIKELPSPIKEQPTPLFPSKHHLSNLARRPQPAPGHTTIY